MNDRHRTIRRFYRRHHDIRMLELIARVEDWTGEVIYEWQKCVVKVMVEKLKEEKMSDLISRQAAIDALARTAREKFNLSDGFNYYLAGLRDGETAIRQLPSAEPDISSYLTDRPCAVCKCHTDDGCSKWECVFERRTDGEKETNCG